MIQHLIISETRNRNWITFGLGFLGGGFVVPTGWVFLAMWLDVSMPVHGDANHRDILAKGKEATLVLVSSTAGPTFATLEQRSQRSAGAVLYEWTILLLYSVGCSTFRQLLLTSC